MLKEVAWCECFFTSTIIWKSDMHKDTGNWLSAQQAVLPDGTEIGNLPLVNKKLPPLAQFFDVGAAVSKPDLEQFNAAVNFALDDAGAEGMTFLRMWRAGDRHGIATQFPAFKGIVRS
ncbi:hypothetical protein RGU70_13100 [Herbaspirillum sp. RTI4]|uniref:hypothetical protein n=1 Tax=Herbaspirillum sp. RTI4 TaxID=3048640 RepID=UPI002AB3458C|nr:hypothetical protein [Herbaspirillum sp. RTI4]MDY7579256.1 hypothetical protein [Herbaspirillum sp. RTI4]MEA9982755.1 hypothetical protein [Herbaspirillum sp. RTI4]